MAERPGFLQLDGVRIEYKWLGNASVNQPVLVFLHEGLGSISMWKEFPEKILQKTGLQGFLYSRQGYGRSDPARLPRTVDYMHHEGLNILPKVLDLAGIEQAILLGHSDGGSISIIHTASDHRRRIKAVVLIAAHVFIEEICIKSIKSTKKTYLKGGLKPRLSPYHDNVDNTFHGWNSIWLNPEFREWNIEDCLPRITVPVLHIQGRQDEYGTVAQVESIKSGIAGKVEIELLDNCGHSPHSDQPEKTIQLIKSFITRYTGA